MTAASDIHVYSKPDCGHCAKAKTLLKSQGFAFTEHDVTATNGSAAEAVFLSGATTVPQIIIGDRILGGADDLISAHEDGNLTQIVEAASATAFPLADLTPETIAKGAEDRPLKHHIAYRDESHTDDEEAWQLLRFYKAFFGFWPNCFGYMVQWPEAYKLFIYAHNAPTAIHSRAALGDAGLSVVAWGNSNAHGCSYCQVHSAATQGERSSDLVRQLEAANAGQAADDADIGPYEASLAMLGSRAVANTITDGVFKVIETRAAEARGGPADATSAIRHAALVSGSFGFLNVYNDLTGVEIEGGWANIAQGVGVEAGRHGASEANPTNLDYELPEGGPTLEETWQVYRTEVGDLDEYCTREFGHVPVWLEHLPEAMQPYHAYMLGELLGDRAHSDLSGEFKHLLCHVAAHAKGHRALAATHAFIAGHLTKNPDTTAKRIQAANDTAMTFAPEPGLFSDAEIAALHFARLSTNVPLITPSRFTEPLARHYSEKQLVEIVTVCAIASMIQRMSAIYQIALPDEVAKAVSASAPA